MTDFTTSQGFQFRLTGVTGNSFYSTTMQNVKKRVEKILYLESPPNDAIKISYVGSKELSPTNNLYIGDRSDSLYANSRTGRVQEFTGITQPVYVRNKNFIVTQKLNSTDADVIPLYFKHILPLTIVPESVRLYDKDLQPLGQDKYVLELQYTYDEETGIPDEADEYHLYNNLESTYNYDTGEYNVYFIQYTDSSGSSDITYTTLLSNELAYKEATFEDIWHLTLDLKPWAKAYILDPVTLTVRLPQPSTEYAVQYQENKRVSVKSPVTKGDRNPWFPRVINGAFNTGYAGYSYKYDIPEFENQAFNPIEPYKTAVAVSSVKVDSNLIKLPHEDIQHGSIFSYVYILFKLDGVVEYAVTNDPFTSGTQYRDFDNALVLDSNNDPIEWSSSLFLGIDDLSGIVHVDLQVKDSHEIIATYSYKELYYEVTGINMNPIFDSGAQTELRVIYINPQSIANNNEGVQSQSIQWLKVSPSGLINSLSQDGENNNENLNSNVALDTSSGYKITGAIGLHYNWRATTTVSSTQEIIYSQYLSVSSTSTFPRDGWIRFEDLSGVLRYAKFVDKTDTQLILSPDQDKIAYDASGVFIQSGTTVELVNFVDERTVLSNRTSEYELAHKPSSPANFLPPSFSRYFILAEMSINEPHSRKDLVQIDVRENGGGIRDDKYDEAKLLNPQAQWFSDFASDDGQPYPGNAVIVVKVPINKLDTFTEDKIKRIVDDNVPFGVQPIIRYYGYRPRIISVMPENED